ncbi:nucleoside-diphosphate kinase [Paenibacillus sp. NPDC058071]|uniref:nucleoside-diphosphate kinase n=1 Tax=Paenibacillus sp. NPDC058071 TaxID=3346326 RepID=UPI0036D791D5
MKLINTEKVERLGAIFLGADAFFQGEVMPIIQFLEDNGFTILRANVKRRLTRNESEEIFLLGSDHLTKNEYFRWWMVNDLVTSGPMTSLLVYSADEQSTCLAQLNRLKGAGDPFYNTNDTIRGKFNSVNIAMNLVHVPDNYKDIMKDTAPFYTQEELEAAVQTGLENVQQAGRRGQTLLPRHELFELKYFSSQLGRNYSFFKSLYLCKYEILRGIADDYGQKSLLRELCIGYLEDLGQNRIANLSGMRRIIGEEKALANELFLKIKNEIAAADDSNAEYVNAKCTELNHLYTYLCLSDEDAFHNVKDKQLQQLQSVNPILTDKDELILLTTLSQWAKYKI